jgi:hypothetical protein
MNKWDYCISVKNGNKNIKKCKENKIVVQGDIKEIKICALLLSSQV